VVDSKASRGSKFVELSLEFQQAITHAFTLANARSKQERSFPSLTSSRETDEHSL
jgi:hypothetical protein